MPHAKVNGFRLYYEVHGQGDPLLLIAGLAWRASDWSLQATALAEHFQVVTYDHRCIGRSDYPSEPCRIADLARDAGRLLEVLGLGPAHVLGFGAGGLIAVTLALDRPQRVRSLVLAGTFARPSPYLQEALEVYRRFLEAGDTQGMMRQAFLWSFTPEYYTRHRSQLIERAATMETEGLPIAALLDQIEAVQASDLTPRLSQIHCPTLVIVGEADFLYTPRHYGEELHRGIPNSRLVEIPSASHAMHLEQPDRFNEEVLRFFRSLR